MLADDGLTNVQISRVLLLDDTTIARHIADFKKSNKLKPENGGSSSKLSDEQATKPIEHIDSQTYTKAADICAYVQEKFGISYSVQGMTNWLHAHGFSFKQPKEVPAKADPQKQEEFLESYEELRASTPENEPIFFADAAHPTMSTKVTKAWIRKGKDKQIETTASRTRVNLIGALNVS